MQNKYTLKDRISDFFIEKKNERHIKQSELEYFTRKINSSVRDELSTIVSRESETNLTRKDDFPGIQMYAKVPVYSSNFGKIRRRSQKVSINDYIKQENPPKETKPYITIKKTISPSGFMKSKGNPLKESFKRLKKQTREANRNIRKLKRQEKYLKSGNFDNLDNILEDIEIPKGFETNLSVEPYELQTNNYSSEMSRYYEAHKDFTDDQNQTVSNIVLILSGKAKQTDNDGKIKSIYKWEDRINAVGIIISENKNSVNKYEIDAIKDILNTNKYLKQNHEDKYQSLVNEILA